MATIFPPEFRFGIGDSDLQVIGEEHCLALEGSEPSMWLEFCRQQGRIWNGDTPLRGVDRYHRWREDVAVLADLGLRHFRTSVSVSRLLRRDGTPNPAAVRWYRDFLGGLRARGIDTYVTLYHWELPQFLQERGGWTSYETVEFLARHAAVACEELGDLISEYFTINEPWCAAFLGHHQGVHAPGEHSLSRALSAAHHLLLANSAMAGELWRRDPGLRVSVVLSTLPCYALTSSPEDLRAVRLADAACNGWFLDPLFHGRYPEELRALVEPHLPQLAPGDLREIQVGARMHAVGINNYYGLMVEDDPAADLRYRSRLMQDAPTNDLGWPVFMPPYYPSGIYDMLHQIWHAYRGFGLKRIYVSENGMAERPLFDENGRLRTDHRRIAYLSEHLERVVKAVRAGVPVEAYFAWTFLDNFEWEHGYRPESSFGLVHVDRGTLERTPKASAAWYAELVRTRNIPMAPA